MKGSPWTAGTEYRYRATLSAPTPPAPRVLENGDFGIYLGNGAQNNTIGGDTGAKGNVITGNARDGIYIADNTTSGNVISHNRIGTDLSGTVDLGNGQSGIELDFGTHGNIIGPGNVVAYNKDLGIWVRTPPRSATPSPGTASLPIRIKASI